MKRFFLIIGLMFIFLLATSISGSAASALPNYTYSIVADIIPGPGHGMSWPMSVFNNKLYTQTDDGVHGRELWVYDGINPPNMVMDINPGSSGSSPFSMMVFNNKLYFGASDGIKGHELWSYDGISPPTMVADIYSGASHSIPDNFEIFNNKLYFSAEDATYGRELWVYNGTNSPSRVADICSGVCGGLQYNSELEMEVFNNKLYFNGNDGTNGYELWVYDGVNPPAMAADIVSGAVSSTPLELTTYNNLLYFSADNGTNGRELWVYAGTNPPTLVLDINTGAFDSDPDTFHVYKGNLFFRADDGVIGKEMWVQGTSGLPSLLLDINPGPASSFIQVNSADNQMATLNDKLFFLADDGVNGQELWVYDNLNPPFLAADMTPGAIGLVPRRLLLMNEKLYFSGMDSAHGIELWVYEPIIYKEMFYSQATYDGWVRESGENSNKGGLINTNYLICNVGDDAMNRQYRTILHFNTSRIPDDAVLKQASLQYKQLSFVGGDPNLNYGKLWTDIKKGFFSNNPGLVKSDFGAAPSLRYAGYFKFAPTSTAYPIYRALLKKASFPYINLNGITQFRLRFGIDDDNDNTADYLKIFCGDMPVPFNRPVMRVWFYVP